MKVPRRLARRALAPALVTQASVVVAGVHVGDLVYGPSDEHWVKVDVDPAGPGLFRVRSR